MVLARSPAQARALHFPRGLPLVISQGSAMSSHPNKVSHTKERTPLGGPVLMGIGLYLKESLIFEKDVYGSLQVCILRASSLCRVELFLGPSVQVFILSCEHFEILPVYLAPMVSWPSSCTHQVGFIYIEGSPFGPANLCYTIMLPVREVGPHIRTR